MRFRLRINDRKDAWSSVSLVASRALVDDAHSRKWASQAKRRKLEVKGTGMVFVASQSSTQHFISHLPSPQCNPCLPRPATR